ncbi:MAG: hypothetical protein PHF95_02475, partial [bacterium]|nr:hypothetical protein [bacterium]
MRNKFLIASVFLMFIMLISGFVFAHDNKVMHPITLSGKATKLLIDKTGGGNNPQESSYYEVYENFYINMPADYHTGNGNFDRSKITKKGTLGSIIEDDGTRPTNHFLNPYNPPNYEPWWGAIAVNSMEWGKPLWQAAFDEYANGNKELAYQNLGQVCHLLEDTTSPPHVHGDFHVFGIGNYEKWCL